MWRRRREPGSTAAEGMRAVGDGGGWLYAPHAGREYLLRAPHRHRPWWSAAWERAGDNTRGYGDGLVADQAMGCFPVDAEGLAAREALDLAAQAERRNGDGW